MPSPFQIYVEKNFPFDVKEMVVPRGVKLNGSVDLSEYKELTYIYMVDAGLTNFNFLNTISNKEKLIKLDLGHNATSNYRDLLWIVSQFSNLESVSLHGIKTPNISLKPLTHLPKCHTFLVEKNLDWGWEYSLDVLTKLYCDNDKNTEFLKWKKDHGWVRTIATNEARLERENERLKQQCHNLQHQELEQQNQQLSIILFPNQPYNFNQLKQEIIRLKYQELAPQVREEKVKFEQLIANTKTKVGNHFEKIIDLFLETQKQREKTTDVSQKDKLSGKIEAYQSVLENNLSKEEFQVLLNKHTEVLQLEGHLESLQINTEQIAHIIHTNNC